MGVYYIDGEFLPREQAVLPVTDTAILRGYGVFDFLRTYGGKPFHLEDHIRRLKRSAELMELSCPWSSADIAVVVEETLAKNSFEESGVRIMITGGDSPDTITPAEKTRLLVMVNRLAGQPGEWYTDGIRVITSDAERHLPGAKSMNYSHAIVALKKARKSGAVESLYVDRSGCITEGSSSNFFAFIAGRFVTPDSGMLPGITRQVVMELAQGEFTIERRGIKISELEDVDEAFIAATGKEIVPVVRVDDKVIGSGRPGPRTLRMMKLFRTYTDAYAGNGGNFHSGQRAIRTDDP